jgi:hypothetical protein
LRKTYNKSIFKSTIYKAYTLQGQERKAPMDVSNIHKGFRRLDPEMQGKNKGKVSVKGYVTKGVLMRQGRFRPS